MYTVYIKKVREQKALATLENEFSALDVGHERHSHADQSAVKRMVDKDGVRDMDMRRHGQALVLCSRLLFQVHRGNNDQHPHIVADSSRSQT